MIDETTTDGKRLAQLLASEIHGHTRGTLGRLSVVDADPDVDPTPAGAVAYGVGLDHADGADEDSENEDGENEDGEGGDDANEAGTDEQIATVVVYPEGVDVDVHVSPNAARDHAATEGLEIRESADDTDRTTIGVANGAQVKGALRVLDAVADDRLESSR